MPYAQLAANNIAQAVTDQAIPGSIPCEWSDIGRHWTGAAFEDVPPGPPASITPRQFRLALNATGLRAAVDAAVAAADQDTRDTYEYATEFRRSDPVLLAMAAALGKTEAEIDALFALGATL
jgi:hypothetical protein